LASDSRKTAAAAALAALATLLVFLPSLSGGWLNWDDALMVSRNPHIRGFGWDNLRWAFVSSPTGAYQPLAYLSWMLDYSLWGLDPRGYHLVNVLLHSLNASLVFLLARRLLRGEDAAAAWAAAFAALLFALHPLRVESVAWIAERRDTLSGALWLGAILAYLRPKRSPAAVYGLYLAACLAKGIAVTLPLVLLILDAWPLRRPIRESVVEKLPMLAAGGALGALAMALQAGERATWSWGAHGLAARLAQSAYALAFYPFKTVWPSGLSPFYEMRPPLDPLEPRFIGAAVLVVLAAAALWRGRSGRPALAAAAGAYAVIVLPVSGLLQAGEQLVADRYSYLATIPFALLGGAALRITYKRPAARAAAALIVLLLPAAAVVQQKYWRSSEALWRRALAMDPASPVALVNLGTGLAGSGRVREAADAFARAIASDPACEPALGDPVKLETRPACRRALNNLGAAKAELGELPEARRLLRLAVSADPGNEGARRNLARVEAALSAP